MIHALFKRLRGSRRNSGAEPEFCVYDWSRWDEMLIVNILPQVWRIGAKIGENPKRLAARLPAGAKTLLIHLDISDDAPFIADAAELIHILAQREIKVLNVLPQNIRKRTIHSCCKKYGLLSPAAESVGDDDELLIVKTDLNAGGRREERLSRAQKARFNLPARLGHIKGAEGYFVARRADLDPAIWKDPDAVVERFIKNPHDRFYRVYVAGNAIVISEAYNSVQIKRMIRNIRRTNYWLWREGEKFHPDPDPDPDCDCTLPPALLLAAGVFIHRFRLDYAAMDVVESEAGEFYIVDVNKTPFWGDENQPGLIEHLRRGFIESAPRNAGSNLELISHI